MDFKPLLYITLAMGLFTGCELETAVNINLPGGDAPMPVVLCFASPTQPTLAFVGLSTPLFPGGQMEDGPTVLSFRVMQGEWLLGELRPGTEEGVFVSDGPLNFQEGVPYHIEIQTLEFETVRSRPEYLPKTCLITHAFLRDSSMGEYGHFNIGVEFEDAQNSQDFYAAKTAYFRNGTALVDSSVRYTHMPLFAFDDAPFNGQNHFFSVNVPKRVNTYGNQRPTAADIMLFNISHGLFRFLSSITQNEGTAQDVLLSPVPVESNIIHGSGVFGLFRSDTVRIAL